MNSANTNSTSVNIDVNIDVTTSTNVNVTTTNSDIDLNINITKNSNSTKLRHNFKPNIRSNKRPIEKSPPTNVDNFEQVKMFERWTTDM
jgi:DNA polymerase sigma